MVTLLSVSALLSLFILAVHGGQSSIQNLTVYTDAGCSQVLTLDTSWRSFDNLSYSQVDNTYINSFGPCVNAFTASVASAQFACVISTATSSSYNGSLYTLSTQEWTSNTGCPSTPAANIRYYFSGRPGLCIPGSVTAGGTTQTAYATYTCNEAPASSAASMSIQPPSALLLFLANVMLMLVLSWYQTRL